MEFGSNFSIALSMYDTPSCVAFGVPTTGGPPEAVKMTYDECCDDV
jgi:hypothetical protein